MFSVIIPLYNKELSIESTTLSVLAQDFPDFELIIVDDGSTDNSLRQIESINDSRLIVLKKENGGVSSARNHAVGHSRREYLAFLDADDLWLPNHLSTLAGLIKECADPAVVFATTFSDDRACSLEPRLIQSDVYQDYFARAALPDGLLSSSSFALKASAFRDVGGYNESYRYGEDVEFWYRLFRTTRSPLVFSSRVTAVYRRSAENRSVHSYIPLNERFSRYDFPQARGSERVYLGKLLFLLIMDYVLAGYLADGAKATVRNLPWLGYGALYGLRLLGSKARRSQRRSSRRGQP
ncbi:glycosyltransferase family 2 protein [Luteimonas sp. A537]